MNFSQAFHETLHRYQLVASNIAKAARLTDAKISTFRNGGNIRIDTLEKILAAMPQEAREYLLKCVAEDPLGMDSDEIPPKP